MEFSLIKKQKMKFLLGFFFQAIRNFLQNFLKKLQDY
jgi:hypothetical protein